MESTVVGGRYRLERLIGAGGMGEVWAAEDTVVGARCAVKLMKEDAAEPAARERFLREARAVRAVRHPSVVAIRDIVDQRGEAPAIVMELLEGEPLRARLRSQPMLELAEWAAIMAPVVSAVGAAHALGVVHRDLKPENIFLCSAAAPGASAVKVLDFGIAKLTALDGEAIRSTGITTGAVLGTPAYMAPEQVFAEQDLDHRADIWALGVISYECLAGVCPTEGGNVGQVLKHVVTKPFEPLLHHRPDLPAEVGQLVGRMLARDPAHRPADLREVLAIVSRFTDAEGVAFEAPALRAQRRGSSAATLASGWWGRPRRWLRFTVLGAIAVGGTIGGAALWPRSEVARSPLDEPGAKLACPVLRASGVEEPAGWLGAAAAAVACERARVLLGGRPERTLAPAELLDLPRGPADAFPDDPYGQAGARERSVAAAQARAQAYLDGEVSWSSAGFEVTLVLRGADGAEHGRAAGAARGLYAAVRAAEAPLVGASLISPAPALEPAVAAWARTSSVDDALAALDLTFAFAHNAGELRDECARFAARAGQLGELGPEGRWLCEYTLGRSAPEVVLPTSDQSDAARATRVRIDYLIHRTKEPGAPALLRAMFERERTPRGRSLLAATESCLLGTTAPREALARGILAVESEPKNPEGGWCNPWEQLMTLERDTRGAAGAARAMQAWVPWNSYAWFDPGVGSSSRPSALPLLRRAYTLSPFDAQVASALAGAHLAAGDRAAARSIAFALRAGGLRLHEVESALLLVRVESSEARFGSAIEQAKAAAQIDREDAGWVRAQRFEIAWRAFELAVLLGRDRAREVADWIVARFIETSPSPLDGHAVLVPIRVPAICLAATAADRCFERFRALRTQLPGAITQDTDDLLDGAERYARRDLAGAAAAWRPLLAGHLERAAALPDAMVDALERTGATELAEQIDHEVMKRAGELNGATAGHVRAARRALARGEREGARQLAEKVIGAWGKADAEPSGLAEARRLLAQLGAP